MCRIFVPVPRGVSTCSKGSSFWSDLTTTFIGWRIQMSPEANRVNTVRALFSWQPIYVFLIKVAEGSEGVSAAAKAVELRFLVGLSEIMPSEKNPTRCVKALHAF